MGVESFELHDSPTEGDIHDEARSSRNELTEEIEKDNYAKISLTDSHITISLGGKSKRYRLVKPKGVTLSVDENDRGTHSLIFHDDRGNSGSFSGVRVGKSGGMRFTVDTTMDYYVIQDDSSGEITIYRRDNTEYEKELKDENAKISLTDGHITISFDGKSKTYELVKPEGVTLSVRKGVDGIYNLRIKDKKVSFGTSLSLEKGSSIFLENESDYVIVQSYDAGKFVIYRKEDLGIK